MEQQIQEFLKYFISIVWEAFPFVVLGALVAGILEELVPQQAIAKLVPRNRFLAIGVGGLLGLGFPMCECGIVPVMRRLLRKGLPLGTCVTYMLAGPIINLVVISSTYVAFSGFGLSEQMTGLRVGIGFMVACTTGLIVERLYRKEGNALLTALAAPRPGDEVHPAEQRAGEKRGVLARIGNISETALHDFIDIMVFLTLGSMLAAAVKVWVLKDPQLIRDISVGYPVVAILAMMLLAVLMCLCSEADAFVAASFTTLHPAAKIAFLTLGPMFDLKLLLMFTRVFRPKLIGVIVVSVTVQVFCYSLLTYFVWQALDIEWVMRSSP